MASNAAYYRRQRRRHGLTDIGWSHIEPTSLVMLEARLRRGLDVWAFANALSRASGGWPITAEDVADFEAGLAQPEPVLLNAAALLADEAVDHLARGQRSAERIRIGRMRLRRYRRLEVSARVQGLAYRVSRDLAARRRYLDSLGSRICNA